MRWSLNLGKIAGIKILLHWTFLMLLLWIGLSQYYKGNSVMESLYAVISLLAIFLCVVLHELGHALTAKKYGIQTRRIILLPIGGIADLERLPENPKHELIIALAGPAVNLIIAGIMYFAVPVNELILDPSAITRLSKGQLLGASVFSINIMLALFNLIPAFPMDGGRVLRAFLSMITNRIKATKIAAGIGQLIAVIFTIAGLFYNPFLCIIGIFIFFSAYSENYMLQYQEFLGRFVARDAMITNFTRLHPDETLKDVSDKIIAGSESDFIVCENDKPIGIITYALLVKELKENRLETKVREVMSTEFELIRSDEHLDKIFIKLQKYRIALLPVIENHQLAGIINISNINEFLVLRAALR